jgi:hypothetical protein
MRPYNAEGDTSAFTARGYSGERQSGDESPHSKRGSGRSANTVRGYKGRGHDTVASKKHDCDLDTTWLLLENSISENEPKFNQAGVEKLRKQSQKRTQIGRGLRAPKGVFRGVSWSPIC